MELVHDFTVPVPADQAWEVLTDIERIVPCMPGATITSVEGDAFEGGMKIKLGPIGMTFKGQGAFVEKDADQKTAVIQAKGRDAKGNGGAQAVVTAALSGSNGTTNVHVVTDLNVSGKAAQFGTGVMKDVSNRLLAQFADNLAAQLTSEPTTAAPPASAGQASAAAPVTPALRPFAPSLRRPTTGWTSPPFSSGQSRPAARPSRSPPFLPVSPSDTSGARTASSKGRSAMADQIITVDPATGSEIARYDCMSTEDIDGVLEQVTGAQKRWARPASTTAPR